MTRGPPPAKLTCPGPTPLRCAEELADLMPQEDTFSMEGGEALGVTWQGVREWA